jgi:transcription elongation factor Elf1
MTRSKSGAWYRRGAHKIHSQLKRYQTSFRCPLCYVGRCEVKMNRKSNTAKIQCDHCHKQFETSIHSLSAPIDVYTDWTTSLKTPSDTGTASFKTPVKEEVDEQKMTRSVGSQDSQWGEDASDDDDASDE